MFNFNTLFIGMDVHKESFSLCYYDMMANQVKHEVKMDSNVNYVVNYVQELRKLYGQDAEVLCGYEAGCLGFSLYHQLQAHDIPCVVIAPTTMMIEGRKRVKTDKKDAAQIAKALAFRGYKPVHIPTDEDEQVKEYIRMRTDHKLALKKVKQQILAFCLRHDYRYTEGTSNWTQKHLHWLRSLNTEGLYAEILTEYLLTYDMLVDKIERFDQRIEELAQEGEYQEKVSKLSCFIGIKTITALSIVTEIGDLIVLRRPNTLQLILVSLLAKTLAEKQKRKVVLQKLEIATLGVYWWNLLSLSLREALGINQRISKEDKRVTAQKLSLMRIVPMNA